MPTLSDEYNITTQEYCNAMRKYSEWGGGPELIALCNEFKIPIHVYELKQTNNRLNNEYGKIFYILLFIYYLCILYFIGCIFFVVL